MTEPCDFSAVELLALYRSGALSPVEATRSVLGRIEAADGLLGATWAVKPEAALDTARQSEARWRAGASAGPLDGVPVSIKEMIATAGDPRPVGTAAGDMSPQPVDAPPAARLREAGAVLWGKTSNPDYGMLSSGLSSFHRLARNPWDVALTPGGSSAGAAAAAAAGYGPLHLGTDIGGSVRLPAGWCGLFALKPSFGRVPIDPPFFGRVAGPMTRTVADSALMMATLAAPDARDYMALPDAAVDWGATPLDLRGLRVGLMLDAGVGLPVDPEVTAAVAAAARLVEAAGAVVEPVAPVMTRAMLDGMDRFWRARSWSETRALPAERYATILPFIRDWLEAAADYDGLAVYRGFEQMVRMREAGMRAFEGYDFWLSPVAPITAFPAEWASPTRDPARPFEHIGFTLPYNFTEQPAATINCGYSAAGLPIGLQIVGRRFDDAGVLGFAAAFEAMRGPQRDWPKPWA